MKKIIMTLVAAMTLTAAQAETRERKNNNAKAVAVTAVNMNNNYDMRVNYRALSSTLGLNDYQREVLEMVHDRFVVAMHNAERANAAERPAKVRKAAATELKNMSYVLTKDQYRKFNMLLNTTLVNRGLLW